MVGTAGDLTIGRLRDISLYHAKLFHNSSGQDAEDEATQPATFDPEEVNSLSASRACWWAEDKALDKGRCGASKEGARKASQERG